MSAENLRIRSVDITNFRSIAHRTTDFGTKGLTLINGPIGAGKSSTLEAARFGIFGAPRPQLQQLIRKEATGPCVVEVHFQAGDDEYQVRRTLSLVKKKGKAPSVRMNARVTVNGVVLDGINPSEVTGHLESVLGMKQEAYSSATYIAQHQAEALAMATPAQLEQYVEAFTGLDAVTSARKKARQTALDAEKNAESMPGSQEQMDLTSQFVDSAENDVTEAARKMGEKEKLMAAARAQMNDAAEQLAAAEKACRDSEMDQQARQRAQARRDAAEQSLAHLDARVDASVDWGKLLSDLEDKQQQLTEQAQAYCAAMDRQKAYQDNSEAANKTQQKLGEVKEQREQLLLELNELVETNDRTRDDNLGANEHTIAQGLDRARGKIAEVDAAIAALHSRQQALSTSEACCPTCQQSIDDPAALLHETKQELNTKTAIRSIIQHDIEHARDYLQSLKDQAWAIIEQRRKHEQDIRLRIQECEHQISALTSHIDSLTTPPQQSTDMESLNEQVVSTATEIYTLSGQQPPENNIDTANLARAAFRAGAATVKKAAAQQALAAEHASAVEALARAEERLQQFPTDLKAPPTAQEREQLAARRDATAAEYKRINVEFQKHYAEHERAKAALENAKGQYVVATEQWREKRGAQMQAADQRAAAEIIAALRADLIHEYCEVITQRASKFLQDVDPRFESVTISTDFTVEVTLAGGKQLAARMLSGGEQALVGIALRLGITELLGSQQQLVADEITSSLDDELSVAVVTALKKRFDHILMVAHCEAVEPLAEHIHTVTDGAGSVDEASA